MILKLELVIYGWWPQILQIVEAERFDFVSEWTETINELISDLVSWAERAMIYKSLVEVSSFLQTTKRDKLRYSNKLTKFLNKIIPLFHLHPRNLQWLTFEHLNSDESLAETSQSSFLFCEIMLVIVFIILLKKFWQSLPDQLILRIDYIEK